MNDQLIVDGVVQCRIGAGTWNLDCALHANGSVCWYMLNPWSHAEEAISECRRTVFVKGAE